MKNYATYNALMKHMRDGLGIQINGSTEKSHLLRVGYYHGVKGYRFYGESTQTLPLKSFREMLRIISYDEELKAILYQPVMQLEVAIKSYVCRDIIDYVGSSNFSDLFERGFDNSVKNKEAKYRTRDEIYSALTRRYKNSRILKHYYTQDRPIPLWAIFEELTLGDLSRIIDALDPSLKLKISDSFGIPKVMNTDGSLFPKIVLAIKDLRNAIAHNKVVYDGRYIEFKKRNSLKNMVSGKTGVQNISLDSFIDDLVLLCFCMKNLSFPKKQLLKMVVQVERAVAGLKEDIPNKLYQQVAGNVTGKLIPLKAYIKKK